MLYKKTAQGKNIVFTLVEDDTLPIDRIRTEHTVPLASFILADIDKLEEDLEEDDEDRASSPSVKLSFIVKRFLHYVENRDSVLVPSVLHHYLYRFSIPVHGEYCAQFSKAMVGRGHTWSPIHVRKIWAYSLLLEEIQEYLAEQSIEVVNDTDTLIL